MVVCGCVGVWVCVHACINGLLDGLRADVVCSKAHTTWCGRYADGCTCSRPTSPSVFLLYLCVAARESVLFQTNHLRYSRLAATTPPRSVWTFQYVLQCTWRCVVYMCVRICVCVCMLCVRVCGYPLRLGCLPVAHGMLLLLWVVHRPRVSLSLLAPLGTTTAATSSISLGTITSSCCLRTDPD
jgi:hypothetical protein